MTIEKQKLAELEKIDGAGLTELIRRVQDINNSYRAVAEKMGQLYMCADELKFTALTQELDKPMRNASDNEQMFSAALEELQAYSKSKPA